MQRFWSQLAVVLGKRVGLVSVVGLILMGLAGLGITQLKFATGQDSYLNSDEQVATDNVAYQKLFGGQAMLTVITMDEGHAIDELFDAATRQQFVSVHDEIRASAGVQGVITPLTALEFSDALVQDPSGDITKSIAGGALLDALAREPEGSPEAAARTEDSGLTLGRVGAIDVAARTIDNPEWNRFLLYDNAGEVRKALRTFMPDTRHAQIITRLVGNQSIEDEGAAADHIAAATAKLDVPNAKVVTTGAPLILKDLNDYLRGGMLSLGGVALGIMMLILVLFFHVRWRLLPMLVIVVGVTLAFGMAGFLGIPLTVVTIAGLPVMLGVGIDYAIQMHARIEEEVILDRAEHPIQESARKLGPALLVVTFDAVFAFLALQFAKVPMIRDFGLLLAVGIAIICVCSIVLPMAPLGMREFRSPTTGKDFREGALGRLVVKLGSLPEWIAVPFIFLSIAIFLGGVLVEDRLELQTDPVRWINQDTKTSRDFREAEKETGSSSELGVFVQTGDVFTDEFVSWVHVFTQDQLRNHPDQLLTGNSIETTIGDLLEVPGASDIAPKGNVIRAAYEVAPDDIKSSTVSPDHQSFNIAYRTAAGSLEDRAPIVRQIRDDTVTPEGIRATPSGLAVVGVGLLDNLQENRILLTYLAILFVFLFLSVRLRSVIRSLLSLVPVLIAVGAASLIAWAFDLVLSPMTAVGGPLVIAACTEFTSLILLRFVEERHRGLSPKDAVDVTAARTGRAFIVSGMTAIAGVAVLSFSSLPLLRDFGRIVAMNVAVALFSALVVLPPMLVWADRRRWVTRHLVTVPDEPYIPTPGSATLGLAERPGV